MNFKFAPNGTKKDRFNAQCGPIKNVYFLNIESNNLIEHQQQVRAHKAERGF